jgi:uncharacterized protein (TIGR02145 family)
MFLIKTLLTGLTGVSLCIADIGGIVTDTSGTTPIAGAIVKLEQGGLTDTTDSTGSFILTSSATGINSHFKTKPGNLFATMKNGLLYVNVAEKVALQITTFDLTGKVLSTVRKAMDAGNNSIRQPYRGSGIYLYKVKAGNSETVLKGNSVIGVSTVSAESSQGSSSNNPLAKQATATAATDDVISVTKDGYLNYREVANPKTSEIVIKMIASAGTVTDADSNVYQAVKIGNQVWTVENLRVTRYNDSSAITKITSNTTWDSCYYTVEPAYCFCNNIINADSIKKYGALYNWYVVSQTNPKKIAPAGWHVPTDAEWDTLQNYLIAKGYNWDGTTTDSKIAKSLAAKTDWYSNSSAGTIGCDLTKNNSSGFSALPGGYRSSYGSFYYQSSNGYWWSATENDASHAYRRYLDLDSGYLYRSYAFKSYGFSVRLVRD